MIGWAVALLCAGGVALLAGTVARFLGGAQLSDDERRGAQRLSLGLWAAAGVQMLLGLSLLLVSGR